MNHVPVGVARNTRNAAARNETKQYVKVDWDIEVTIKLLQYAFNLSESDFEYLKTVGISEQDTVNSKRNPDSLKCYLELHIEQGNVLNSENLSIGVVKGIVGIAQYNAKVKGKANHAGTTPMNLRVGFEWEVNLDEGMQSLIEESCQELNYSYKYMVSGAGHDANPISKITPTGMIFIPSKDGISHSPLEWSEWDDVEKGANVLLNTVIKIDGNNYAKVSVKKSN